MVKYFIPVFIGFIFFSCGISGYKLIYRGKDGVAFSRPALEKCDLLWTSLKENGITEDVYGPPCNTIIQYQDKK